MSDTRDHDQEQRDGHEVESLPATCGDYDSFSRWFDAELEKLVKRWIHLAAPKAGRSRRALRRAK
jgi:hypothetical protein